jgi:hypothetical protein
MMGNGRKQNIGPIELQNGLMHMLHKVLLLMGEAQLIFIHLPTPIGGNYLFI